MNRRTFIKAAIAIVAAPFIAIEEIAIVDELKISTSVYIITWGEKDLSIIYPKGTS